MQEQEWLRHIRTTAEEGVPIILVGNKADKGTYMIWSLSLL